jgi:glycosyltransferase involved in cell wall biosynthesis
LNTQPVRVMYDEQIFLLQEYGGISKYFTELIKNFESNPDLGISPSISSNWVRNQYLIKESKFTNLKRVTSRSLGVFLLFVQMVMHRRTKQNVDLVHHTFYIPGCFGRFRGLPKAVTLFDMIPERTPSGRMLWNPHFAKKLNLSRADLVFSISESSTRDMLDEYAMDRTVVTTYLGVGPEFSPGLPLLNWQTPNYFLFVGNRDGYKDFNLAIRAFATVSREHPDVNLQLVGGGKLTRAEKQLISELGVLGSVIHRSVSSEELPNVYSNALALVYPTRYEGFGLPLVEAMASGVPIVASDTPINKEIAMNCASYFPVGEGDALCKLMNQSVSNPEVFQDKINVGKKRAHDFTWRNCAEKTAAEYRRLVDKQREIAP